MSYLVLARKWRPKSFSEVVGQQHVLRALINGLDQNRLHHAFLFSGTRGVGKTTLARIFAKSLNCEQGISSTPCGECQSCQEVDAGRFVDLIEVDAASRTKVDDTRELLDNVQYAPSRGRYKVYLIDEVHMLSTSSFNALLKTLEEPPPHVKFLFATTDPQKLPVTILSRCLQFNLRRLEQDQISNHLAFILEQEKITFESQSLFALARAADGSMRDALSLLDQAIAFGGGAVKEETVTQMLGSIHQDQLFQLLHALAQGDGQQLLALSTELASLGRDFTVILDALLTALQQIATLQCVPNLQGKEQLSPDLLSLASLLDAELVQLFYQIALHGKRDMPWAADPKSGFEMTLLRMLSFQPAESVPVLDEPSPTKKSEPVKRPVTSSPSLQPVPPRHSERSLHSVSEAQTTVKPSPQPEAKQVNASLSDLTLTAENWTSTVEQIKLSALAHQLAENAAFVRTDGQQVYLTISPELNHLATDNTKQKLQTALSKQFGTDIQLKFIDQNEVSQSVSTLAQEKATFQAERQQQAVDSIATDPTIEIIKNTFNARIIEQSIKPADE